jgi:hypothetical protein
MRLVRVLPHIKRLDDCFGEFVVRVTWSFGRQISVIQGKRLRRRLQ